MSAKSSCKRRGRKSSRNKRALRKQARLQLQKRETGAQEQPSQPCIQAPGVVVNVNVPSANESKERKHPLSLHFIGWLVPVNLCIWLLLSGNYSQEDKALVKTFLQLILKVIVGYL